MKKLFSNENITIIIIALFALLIRIIIASQDIAYIDRLFIPDDTYYTLKISQSLSRGLGPSYDGITLTNGFQPLLAFIQIPFFYLSRDIDLPLKSTIFLTGFLGSLVTLLVGFLSKVLINFKTAILSSIFVSLSPIIISSDLNGLETSLAGFFLLFILIYTLKMQSLKSNLKLFILGVLCGFSMLARIDSVFLVGILGLYVIPKWGIKGLFFVVFGASVILFPWWIYSYINFKSIIPSSGSAVKLISDFSKESYRFKFTEPYYALQIFSSILPFSSQIKNLPKEFLLIISSLIFFIITVHPFRKLNEINKNIYLILIIMSKLFFVFYVFYLPAFWFFDRYLYFFLIFSLIALASLLTNLIQNEKIWIKSIGLFLVITIIISYLFGTIKFFNKPDETPYTKIPGPKGYREIAMSILNELPDSSVIGAMQSGALNYYSNGRVKVLNLDGVVNKEAFSCLKEKNLRRYVEKNKMKYFADWPINGYMFMQHYSRDFLNVNLYPLKKFKKQGNTQFILYEYKLDQVD